jgi:photosystem II stability/assembly factor-like uncharacterized protein
MIMNPTQFFVALLYIAFTFTSCSKNSSDNHPNSPSPCYDGVQNNGETGVDCGGPCSACPKVWTAVNSGTTEDLYSVYFADTSNGWVVGTGGVIIHSSDGGNNWVVQSSGISDSLNSVYFIDASIGWIAGRKNILKTTDGGNSWTNIVTAPPNQSFYSIFFIDQNKGWVGGSNANQPFLNYTSDGGSIWITKYSGVAQTGSIRSMDFVNQFIGFAVGDSNGLSVKTTDGGTIWNEVSRPFTTPLYACDFSSATDGWSTGVHNYYYDVNLEQWHQQNFLPENVILRGIKIISAGEGWVVGDAGTVYKRTGTNTWDIVTNVTTTNNFYSVSVAGSTACIVGEAGSVYILQ